MLSRDRSRERVRELVDLAAQIVKEPLALPAALGRTELGRDAAQVVEHAADLDQAIVQLVHSLGVLVAVLVLVELVCPVARGGAGDSRVRNDR